MHRIISLRSENSLLAQDNWNSRIAHTEHIQMRVKMFIFMIYLEWIKIFHHFLFCTAALDLCICLSTKNSILPSVDLFGLGPTKSTHHTYSAFLIKVYTIISFDDVEIRIYKTVHRSQEYRSRSLHRWNANLILVQT